MGILIAKAGQVAIVPQKLLLHFADILRRQIAQFTSMLQGDGCCRAHGLSAYCTGGNDARRGHGQLACAQCAAPGQQIGHVTRDKGAKGDGVAAGEGVHEAGVIIKIEQPAYMHVHGPATIGDGVVKHAVAQHVVFIEHV